MLPKILIDNHASVTEKFALMKYSKIMRYLKRAKINRKEDSSNRIARKVSNPFYQWFQPRDDSTPAVSEIWLSVMGDYVDPSRGIRGLMHP